MNRYVKELNNFLRTCEERDGFSGMPSVLDFLWSCYYCCNPVDDGLIKEKDDVLHQVMKELSVQSADDLYTMISDLIEAYQRAAFLEGIAIGARLEKELTASA